MTLDRLYKDRPEDFRVDLRKAERLRIASPDLEKLSLVEVLRVMNANETGEFK